MFRIVRLQKSSEFREVYTSGKRFDGRLVSVFIIPNDLKVHRLGITASRKFALKAVDRNRAKRLLREAFRQNMDDEICFGRGYDWVLNAKRPLLKVKIDSVIDELQPILLQVRLVDQGL